MTVDRSLFPPADDAGSAEQQNRAIGELKTGAVDAAYIGGDPDALQNGDGTRCAGALAATFGTIEASAEIAEAEAQRKEALEQIRV